MSNYENQQPGKFLKKSEDPNPTQPKKKAQNPMDALKECAKSSLLFGGLNMLIWYWEMAGLMAESIARPSSWVLAVLFGIGIGRCIRKGKC
jgi:hypothetical protein